MRTLAKLAIAGVAVIAVSALVTFAVDEDAPEPEPTHRVVAARSVWLDYQASKPHPGTEPAPSTGSSPGATNPRQSNGQPPVQQPPKQNGTRQPSGDAGSGQPAPPGEGSQQVPPAPDGGPNCDLGAPCDSHYGPPQQDGPSNVGPGPDEAPYQPPGSAGDRWARDQYCTAEGLPPGCI